MGAPVRVGVVGTTPYAEMHLAGITSLPDAELAAICGRDRQRAEDVAARHGAPAVHDGYEHMIASGDIDAVVIIAPDALHSPITTVAASHGVHVLCEKPLATTADEAHGMWRAVEDAGVRHMSFFVLRHTAPHRRLKELVEGGFVGQVLGAELSLTHGFFRRDTYDWRFDAARGTGAIGDLACYLFDLALWWIGDVDGVMATASSSRHRPHPDGLAYEPANDAASGALSFRSGAHATFSVSTVAHQASRLQSNVVRLFGTEGTIELHHTLTGDVALRAARSEDDMFTDVEVPSSGRSPHATGIELFVNAIRNDGPLDCDFAHGLRVQQTVEAALNAAQSRRWTPLAARGGE